MIQLLLLELGKDTFPLFMVHVEVLLRHIALHRETFVEQVDGDDRRVIVIVAFLMPPRLNNVIDVGDEPIVPMLFKVEQLTTFVARRLLLRLLQLHFGGVFATVVVVPDKLYFILRWHLFGSWLVEIKGGEMLCLGEGVRLRRRDS